MAHDPEVAAILKRPWGSWVILSIASVLKILIFAAVDALVLALVAAALGCGVAWLFGLGDLKGVAWRFGFFGGVIGAIWNLTVAVLRWRYEYRYTYRRLFK